MEARATKRHAGTSTLLRRTVLLCGVHALLALTAAAAKPGRAQAVPQPPPAPVEVSGLSLAGEIDGENITFTLAFQAAAKAGGALLPLVVGDVAYLDGQLPAGSELVRASDRYLLKFPAARQGWWSKPAQKRHDITLRFASRPEKQGEWRQTSFAIPSASIRRLSVLCDRDDLEVRFPGALKVRRDRTPAGKTQVTAFLGLSSGFEVRWKPEIRKLDAELVAACEANTITTASVGALRLDSVFTYRVIQGYLETISLALPAINVTQVRGDDIQDWRIDRADPAGPVLLVQLGRPKDGLYRLQVEGEMVLPAFPAAFDLPVISPRDVLRTSGAVMIGTDSAIKLKVDKATGLTQVDQGAFPTVAMEAGQGAPRSRPQRSVFAYQYASTPYTLTLGADDIVTTFSADDRLTLFFADRELVFAASIELDIKDAPAREITIETDPDPAWTVIGVTGQHVAEADTDVRDEPADPDKGTPARRVIVVPFKQGVSGAALVEVRMARSLAGDGAGFAAPRFTVLGARSERGYLVVAAEKGVRLKADEVSGLREVHTESAPMRVPGAQQAFRFKEPGWRLSVALTRAVPSIHSEVFHLVSLGEGVAYCSAAITYHIAGAPVQEFRVRVPADIENVEFAGADIEGWTREGDLSIVRLQARVMGDWTLLVTYDRQFADYAADIAVGEVETVDSETEVGYIVLASSESLSLPEAEPLPDWIIKLSRDEVPNAYSAPVTHPILSAYKYVRRPHAVAIKVQPYETEQLLGQIADYVRLSMRLSKDGESVCVASYFLKNASRQYLVFTLPEGARLSSIRQIDADGRKTDVLSQRSPAGYLIPVRRPRDPNTALSIEVEYTQPCGKLGFLRSGLGRLAFRAPSLPETHVTFADWTVALPERFAFSAAGGNVTATRPIRPRGPLSVLSTTARFCAAVLDGWGGRTIGAALRRGWGGGESMEFSRTVGLSDDAPPLLRLRVVPRWMGRGGSALAMAAALAAGALLLALACVFRRRPAVLALGVTALVFGVAQSAAGGAVLALMLSLAVLGVAVWLFCRIGLRIVWRVLAGAARLVWWLLRELGVGAALAWRWIRGSRARASERHFQHRLAMGPDDDLPPFEPDLPAPGAAGIAPQGDPAERGSCRIGMLVLLLLSATLVAVAGVPPPAAPAVVMDSLDLTIGGPGTGRDVEQSATVEAVFDFRAEGPLSFSVLPPTSVLIGHELGSPELRLTGKAEGYILDVRRKGRYRVSLEYQVAVTEKDGEWSLAVPLLPNIRNKVALSLPEAGLDVRVDDGVLFRTRDTGQATEAEAVFGAARSAHFGWRPRVRRTTLEDAVYFCEVNTFVMLRSGVVDLTNLVRYQIAQGEVKDLKLSVPAPMSVTAVRAADLATWSFDPETRLLEAILAKPVSGDFTLTVVTQVPCDGLPYRAVLGVPAVRGVSRQRGSLAVAAVDSIQVRVADTQGLSPMNTADFSAQAVAAAGEGAASKAALSVRRAFRYQQAEQVSATVHTERVLPEIRIVETGTLSIADERIVLATKLDVTLAKSGVFSLGLGIPADFDVETLTGPDVSHWDEEREDVGGVVVHFTRRVSDKTTVNLVMARMEKGLEQRIGVPRVVVPEARKHTGRLTVSAERGVRIMVENHHGVDIKKAAETGISQAGVLLFDILRPNWSIDLKTEVMAPVVKPEVLQWVDLTEGMLQCRAYVRYRIENAGLKTFRLRAPRPGTTISVTGRNIARVHETDKEAGLWQVDLHGKVESRFAMTVTYQIPYDPAEKKVAILPLQTVDTDGQRGYVVVTGSGRVQVEPAGSLSGLKVEDPRNIPGTFEAGDLSHAIRCYRTIRPDYRLDLSVVRHDAADVLPASIRQVRMTSVLSTSGRLLTRAALQMTVRDLRLLKIMLPNRNDRLWTVLVNGKEVATSRDGELYCIPLEAVEGDQFTKVDLVYAGSGSRGIASLKQEYRAPEFVGLPLNDIEWRFFVPPDRRYFGFGGTMEHDDPTAAVLATFNAQRYQEWNKGRREASLRMARQVLDAGEELARSGQQKRAQKAFQQALNYSQGQDDLNEDARVQLNNLVKQQVKMGLVNRRDAVRFSRNIIDEQQLGQMEGFHDGDYTQEYAQRVEKGLSAKDNDALEIVASRIIEQQAAAAGIVNAISITMPEHGRELRFTRAMLTDPSGALTVSFRAARGRVTTVLNALWPTLLLFAGVWVVTARHGGQAKD